MRVSALTDLRCPVSGGSLRIDENIVRPKIINTQLGDDLQEGLLFCEESGKLYPVIAGVAILVRKPLPYLASNFYGIMTSAAGFIEADMVAYIEGGGVDLVSEGSQSAKYNTAANIALYIYHHYGDWFQQLPSDHPLGALMRHLDGDWLGKLIETVKNYSGLVDTALDVGCSVGGLVYKLAGFSSFVYGIDYAFPSVLVARSILLGQPKSLDCYRLPLTGTRYRTEQIRMERLTNVEIVVASAESLPFVKGMFDVVTGANLVDRMGSPLELVRAIDAVLREDGLVLLTDPYDWRMAHSGIEDWIGGRVDSPSEEAMR